MLVYYARSNLSLLCKLPLLHRMPCITLALVGYILYTLYILPVGSSTAGEPMDDDLSTRF